MLGLGHLEDLIVHNSNFKNTASRIIYYWVVSVVSVYPIDIVPSHNILKQIADASPGKIYKLRCMSIITLFDTCAQTISTHMYNTPPLTHEEHVHVTVNERHYLDVEGIIGLGELTFGSSKHAYRSNTICAPHPSHRARESRAHSTSIERMKLFKYYSRFMNSLIPNLDYSEILNSLGRTLERPNTILKNK